MKGDITSANATLVLAVEGLFPSGVKLEQFATDQSWSMEQSTIAVTRMGVDGQMVAGWIPNIKEVTIMLEASSPSYLNLVEVYQAMEQKRGLYRCTLTATIPSIKKTITWTDGVMVTGQPVPTANQVMSPTSWGFHFNDVKISGQ